MNIKNPIELIQKLIDIKTAERQKVNDELFELLAIKNGIDKARASKRVFDTIEELKGAMNASVNPWDTFILDEKKNNEN